MSTKFVIRLKRKSSHISNPLFDPMRSSYLISCAFAGSEKILWVVAVTEKTTHSRIAVQKVCLFMELSFLVGLVGRGTLCRSVAMVRAPGTLCGCSCISLSVIFLDDYSTL